MHADYIVLVLSVFIYLVIASKMFLSYRHLFHFDTGWLILIKYAREPTLWAQSVFVNHQHKRSILERQWTMQVCVSRC